MEQNEKRCATLVIDIGTSSARLLVIDRKGVICTKFQKNYPLYVLNESTAIQKPEEVMEKIWEMLKVAGEWLGQNQMEAEVISVTGQRSSVIPVDEYGSAMTEAISWQDRRAAEICLEYKNEWKKIYQITGMKLSPVFSAPKMVWLKKNKPEVYQRAYKLIGFQEYVIYQLTHQFATDHSIASRTSLFDIKKLEWSEELLLIFGVKKEKLCSLIPVGGIVGNTIDEVSKCLKQRTSIPVISAGGDQQCAALGLGCLEHGDMEVNSGTGAYVIGLSDVPVLDKKMSVNCNVSAIPGKWIVEGAVLSAGKAAAWMNEQFFPESKGDFKEFSKVLEESCPGANGVIASTSFSGKGTPRWNPSVRAGFMGIGFENNKGDLVRALLEGIAAELSECVKEVERVVGGNQKSILAAGGMTGNPVYCQILSDMFQKEVKKPKEMEATGLGAWISAQKTLGNVDNYQEGYERYAENGEDLCYEPDPDTEILYQNTNKLRNYYEAFYESYEKKEAEL